MENKPRLVTYQIDEDGECIARFPTVNSDGTGVLEARYSYFEEHPGNASISATRAYYKGVATVDGVEVFKFDDIGSPIQQGVAVDSEEAYIKVLPALISFASAYEGSGHGEVCNDNPIAYQHETVFSHASFVLDEIENLKYPALQRVYPSVTPPDKPRGGLSL